MSPPPEGSPCRGSRIIVRVRPFPRLHVSGRHLSGQGHSQFEPCLRYAPGLDFTLRCNSDEHVLALVEAVHGAHIDAVHDFAANTALVDDEGQLSVLSASQCELIHVSVRPRGARSWGKWTHEDLRPLAESEHRGQAFSGRGAPCSAGLRTSLVRCNPADTESAGWPHS